MSITDSKLVAGAHGITVENRPYFQGGRFRRFRMADLPRRHAGSLKPPPRSTPSDLLRVHKGKIAAICAAPRRGTSAPLGLLNGKEATCYPGFEGPCKEKRSNHERCTRDVDRKPHHRNGPSAALRFALAIVANSMGENAAQEVGAAMLFYPKSMSFYF